MAIFVVTAPDGNDYEIEGEGTEEQALAEFQRRWSAGEVDKGPDPRTQRNIDVVKEQRDRPWYGRLGQTLDDQMRLAGQGMSLGWGDEIAAGADTGISNLASMWTGNKPSTYEENLATQRQAMEDAKARIASTYVDGEYKGKGGELGASAMEALPAIATLPSVAARALPAGAGAIARGLGYGAEGAAGAGLQAAGTAEGDVEERLKAAAVPAAVGAVTGGAGGVAMPWVTRLFAPDKAGTIMGGKRGIRRKEYELAETKGKTGMQEQAEKMARQNESDRAYGRKQTYPHEEQKLVNRAGYTPNKGDMIDKLATTLVGGGGLYGIPLAGKVLGPAATMAGVVTRAFKGLPDMSELDQQVMKELYNTTKGGKPANPKTVAAARKVLARVVQGGAREAGGEGGDVWDRMRSR